MNDLTRVVTALREFAAERDWAQFHDPKNLAMALSSVVGELSALYRWVRTQDADTFTQNPANRAKIEDELADVTERIDSATGHNDGPDQQFSLWQRGS